MSRAGPADSIARRTGSGLLFQTMRESSAVCLQGDHDWGSCGRFEPYEYTQKQRRVKRRLAMQRRNTNERSR